jgi:hypothetical protein
MLENPKDARCDMYGAWGMWQSLFFQRKFHENEILSIILGSRNVTNVCWNGLLVTYRSYYRKSNSRRTIYSTPQKPKFLFVTFLVLHLRLHLFLTEMQRKPIHSFI